MEIRWLGEVRAHVQSLFLPFPCPYIHGKKAFRSTRIAAFYAHSIKVNSPSHLSGKPTKIRHRLGGRH